MISRSERDVILDHALRDEENLEIALKIGAGYSDLLGRVIARFLEAVERELAPRLGEAWTIAVCRDPIRIAKKWAELVQIDFRGHTGGLHILLGADEAGYPKYPWFGVRSASDSELHEQVKKAIDQEFMAGEVGDPSFWWRMIDKAYSNWGSEDTTLLLYRKGEALDYVVRNLEQLARAVERGLTPSTSSESLDSRQRDP